MAETAWTKGPLVVNEAVASPRRWHIHKGAWSGRVIGCANRPEDAVLWAAAPDMAEALEEALKYLPVDHPVHDMATAALALARGQEQEKK